MFGLFKRTSWKIEGKALDFFDKLFTSLPGEYHFLADGLSKGLYKRFSVNHATKEHHYKIGFDPSQSDKSMIKGKKFELENIIVKAGGQDNILNITVYEGLWIGFEFQKNILDLKDYEIDLSRLNKGKSKFSANEKIEKFVSNLVSEYLDLTTLSEFEIEGKLYYQIKDLEDGNYLAIDNNGKVFGLIHDPYKIELINKSIRQLVDDVNSRNFDFDKYLEDGNGYA